MHQHSACELWMQIISIVFDLFLACYRNALKLCSLNITITFALRTSYLPRSTHAHTAIRKENPIAECVCVCVVCTWRLDSLYELVDRQPNKPTDKRVNSPARNVKWMIHQNGTEKEKKYEQIKKW